MKYNWIIDWLHYVKYSQHSNNMTLLNILKFPCMSSNHYQSHWGGSCIGLHICMPMCTAIHFSYTCTCQLVDMDGPLNMHTSQCWHILLWALPWSWDGASAGCAQGTSWMLLDWGFLDLAHWHFATQGFDGVPLTCAGAMHPLLVACSLAFYQLFWIGNISAPGFPLRLFISHISLLGMTLLIQCQIFV